MPRYSLLDIYRLLPGTNCKECGLENCMSFASALLDRKKKPQDCKPLFENEKYKEKREKLLDIILPAIKEIEINGIKIGGEDVLYRHDLTFYNPTAIFIDVSDTMNTDELISRVKKINRFSIFRVGQDLKLQGIALKCKSNDAVKFGDAIINVLEHSKLPIMLCSFNPEIIEIGAETCSDRKFIIYAANAENYKKMTEIAKKHDAPLVVYADTIEDISLLTQKIMEFGHDKLILDIGTYPEGSGLRRTIENMIKLRRAAIDDRFKPLRFPILANPSVVWLYEKDYYEACMKESYIASLLMLCYADLMILHGLETFEILPLLVLRQNIYTDPRVPVQVKPGIYKIGKPNEYSPILVTTNFALTYYTVANDVEGKIDCYILVLNTEGLAVLPALAGKKLTADLVKEHIEEYKLENYVKHRYLIIPGLAAKLSGEIEEKTGWKVLVGPMDSSRIPDFIEKEWKKLNLQ